jgi:SAM-dependent methyltransferase
VSNEVDGNLVKAAERLARENGVRLDLRQHMWQTIDKDIAGGASFDALLCLGNSLCLVPDNETRRVILTNFYNLIAPGGIMLIDERNYELFQNRRDAIREDPNAFPFLLSDPMYKGTDVRGAPVHISGESVAWRLFNRGEIDGDITWDSIAENFVGDKELHMHSFKRGEMRKLLEDVGFATIDCYVDLKPVVGIPTTSDLADAAFITYIAHKL